MASKDQIYYAALADKKNCESRANLFPDRGYFWDAVSLSCKTEAQRLEDLQRREDEEQLKLLGYVPSRKPSVLEEASKQTGIPQAFLAVGGIITFITAISFLKWLLKE